MSYTSRSIANLKDQVNILDVVSRVVPLKKTGASHKGVCPFHNEKTPSFNVNEQKQMFYCFGCQASGDIIEFVRRYYNLDFNDAVDKLAKDYGIQMEETKGRSENLDKYYVINKDATEFFYKAMTETANKGYSYMKQRNIQPRTIKKFGIGYADENWTSLFEYLKSKGHSPEDMVELGLVSKSKDRYYDKFRNRTIFPIINTRKKVIGFGGRAISSEDNPKYLNSQESKVFQKSNNLYGFNISKDAVAKEGYLILVEGYMDVIGLYQGGIENVAASLGTALTESQARLIKRYVDTVVISYDSDNAGRNAALRAMGILRGEGLNVKVMHVTDGKDPDEFIRNKGKDAFLKLVDNASHYGEYKINHSIRGLNLNDHNDRIKAIKNIAGVLRELSPGEREEYASRTAKMLDISKAVLLEEASMKESRDNKSRTQDSKAVTASKPGKEETKTSLDDKLSQIEGELLKLVLRNEEYLNKVSEHSELLESEISRKLFDTILTSRGRDGSVDVKVVLDQLEEDERRVMYDVMEKILMSGEEDKIFQGLIRKHKQNKLRQEVERINDIIKYAGETEADSQEMKALMLRSMELQREIELLKSEDE